MTQAQALDILKTGANVFLTGEPGAGKTHVVNTYVAYLRSHGIAPAITASTGIAATHIGGMTIHSWSGIGIKTRLDKYDLDRIASSAHIAKRVARTKILIIDEVSMLHADTLSMVDAVCREIKRNVEPFGGMQVVLVGDFFQLPPVTKRMFQESAQGDDLFSDVGETIPPTTFAYQSPVWAHANLIACYLTEQHRQDDPRFLSILSAIRTATFDEEHMVHIEMRKVVTHTSPDRVTKLFSHNADVDRVNSEELGKLPGASVSFDMSARGPEPLLAALKKGCLSPEQLFLKKDATVMFTKNNPQKGFANGTLGIVKDFDTETRCPLVVTRDGRKIEVEPMDWTVEEGGVIRARVTQTPLRLAWAMTVHKSQGMSLDAAVMDLSEVFEYGQGYVALSRVRRLEGLHLLGWNARTFEVHPEVLSKDEEIRVSSENAEHDFGGISSEKLSHMQKSFITASGGSLTPLNPATVRAIASTHKEKVDTHVETLRLWKERNGLKEIAQARGLTAGTILSHLEKLVAEEKIPRTECTRLLTPALTKKLPLIHAAFRAEKTSSLTPVFTRLKGVYSYDDLRLARLLL